MENTNYNTTLIASLNATTNELQVSNELSSGISEDNQLWELIIQYNGSLDNLTSTYPTLRVTKLAYPYAILRLPKDLIPTILSLPEIIYAELPKSLFFGESLEKDKQASCILPSYESRYTGRGVLLAIIDSGIDIFHPDFINPDGSSKILFLYDEASNQIYDNNSINESLALGRIQGASLIQGADISGHGTHVAGIAGGRLGVAPEASLIIVKLASPSPTGFPNTAQLMEGIQFCVDTAQRLNMPMAVNISFGNTYGSHSGTSLLESYIDYVSELGKFVFVIGTGNEGASGGHVNGNSSSIQEFSVGPYEGSLSLQIFKYAWEQLSISIQGPSSMRLRIPAEPGVYRFNLDNATYLYAVIGEATPYSYYQEIFLALFPENDAFYITSGIYRIKIDAPMPLSAGWHIWLPSSGLLSPQTRFLTPTANYTLTIPSTAQKAISVGAYDSSTLTVAPFSGRGFTFGTEHVKPDLVAPGVNIISASIGGGYEIRSGTSMATPFVSGVCCLYMQEGIVDRQDPFLYGEKLKARLISDARQLPSTTNPPSNAVGWGSLCFRPFFY